MATSNQDNFVIEMRSLLEEVETIRAPEHPYIYRVPYGIGGLNEGSFTPKMVSIGPLHYGHPALQNMESYKLLYMKQFCQRISDTIGFDQLVIFVKEIEPNIRLHYSEPIKLSQKEFVKVILLDCCFLFELFLRFHFNNWDGVIKFKPWLASIVRVDLFLLENQLPFPEVESLYNRVFPNNAANDNKNPSFIRLTFKYFEHYNTMKLTSEGVVITHFTDLIRTFQLPPFSQPLRIYKSAKPIYSATELNEAGVRFRKSEGTSIMDFKFSGHILEIPALEVDDSTETFYRNLLALEQCHYHSASYITDYIVIMDFLINTSTDVDLLFREGIIVYWLGEANSVANLFNSLGKNLTIVNCSKHHSNICKDLNAFCKSPLNRMKATLIHDYCRTPWQTAASGVGIVLIVLSFLQTFCSVIQVVPKSP